MSMPFAHPARVRGVAFCSKSCSLALRVMFGPPTKAQIADI